VPASVPAGTETRPGRRATGPLATEPRWIIHLPTMLTSLDAAVELVAVLRASLAHVPALDFGEATLSEEDQQVRRTRNTIMIMVE